MFQNHVGGFFARFAGEDGARVFGKWSIADCAGSAASTFARRVARTWSL